MTEKNKQNIVDKYDVKKNIGNLANFKMSGYYWVKVIPNAEWEIVYYNNKTNTWRYINRLINVVPAVVNWNMLIYCEPKKGKSQEVYKQFSKMEVGDEFNKDELILELWGNIDFYIRRSFSVFQSSAVKKLNILGAEKYLEPRIYKTSKNIITRIQ